MSETSKATPIDEDSLHRLHMAIDLLVASSRGADAKATRYAADAVIHFLAVVLRGAGLPDLASAHWLVNAWQREYPTTPAMSTYQVIEQIAAAAQKVSHRERAAQARVQVVAGKAGTGCKCKCFGCETRFVQVESGEGLRCPRCDSVRMVETYGECLTDEQAADWTSRAF